MSYIIHDNEYTIWGLGRTVDDAWEDAKANVTGNGEIAHFFEDGYRVVPATEALYREVLAMGSDVTWGVLGGVARTNEELG